MHRIANTIIKSLDLRENTTAKALKIANERLGLDVAGHGLRRLFVTTLVNDPAVGTEEFLSAARHGSVAAQLLLSE